MKTLMQNLLKLQTLEFNETKGAAAAAEIAALRGKIPAPILGHYDRLRERGKKAVAVVKNQVCTACHMRPTLGVLMTLQHGQDIQLCENCGRYLCLPEEKSAPPAAAPAAAKPARATRKRKPAAPKKG
jgi:predicted  nucleic acid-binding Zn-ribbon protein